MSGPLTRVNTLVAGINLDVSRLLNYGTGKTLELVVPDVDELDGLAVVATFTKNWDRIKNTSQNPAESNAVIFKVADVDGELEDVIGTKDMMVRIGTDIFDIKHTPFLNPNEAQVYIFNCRVRNFRNRYFDQTK